VVVAAGGISRAGTTNASGVTTIALTLILTPGTYGVSASFLPTTQYAGSQTLGSVEVRKAPTAIALSVGASTTPGAVSAIATLSSGTENLLQRTVAFVITAPGGAKSLVTGITD